VLLYLCLMQNLPFYRLVVAEQRWPRDGKHLEVLGWYDPLPGASSHTSIPGQRHVSRTSSMPPVAAAHALVTVTPLSTSCSYKYAHYGFGYALHI
jgi:Ribosomal protein S16